MDLQHLRASDGTGEAVLAHIQSVRNPGSTVLDLDNVDNWNSKVVVVTGTPAANGYIAAAGMKVMYGHISSGDLVIDGFAPGYTDNGNTTQEVALVKMCTAWADVLVGLLQVIMNDDGTPRDWIKVTETWTFASWDLATRTGTITVPTDATTKYSPGMRVRINQSTGGTKYGIITAVATSLLTVFFPSGVVLENQAITVPFYSSVKIPFGFPFDPVNWQLQLVDTTIRSKTAPTNGVYYNSGATLAVPVGLWDCSLSVDIYADATTGNIGIQTALSTSASAVSDQELLAHQWAYAGAKQMIPIYVRKVLNFTVPKTLYVIFAQQGGAVTLTFFSQSSTQPLIITATCAYL